MICANAWSKFTQWVDVFVVNLFNYSWVLLVEIPEKTLSPGMSYSPLLKVQFLVIWILIIWILSKLKMFVQISKKWENYWFHRDISLLKRMDLLLDVKNAFVLFSHHAHFEKFTSSLASIIWWMNKLLKSFSLRRLRSITLGASWSLNFFHYIIN